MLSKHTEIHFFVVLKMKIFNRAERYTLFVLYGRVLDVAYRRPAVHHCFRSNAL